MSKRHAIYCPREPSREAFPTHRLAAALSLEGRWRVDESMRGASWRWPSSSHGKMAAAPLEAVSVVRHSSSVVRHLRAGRTAEKKFNRYWFSTTLVHPQRPCKGAVPARSSSSRPGRPYTHPTRAVTNIRSPLAWFGHHSGMSRAALASTLRGPPSPTSTFTPRFGPK